MLALAVTNRPLPQLPWRPTLTLAFVLGLGLVAALLLGLLGLLAQNADRAMDQSAAAIARTTATLVGERVERHLTQAEDAITAVQTGVVVAAFDADHPDSAARAMLATLAARPDLLDATWTHSADGQVWQVSAIRVSDALGDLVLRRVQRVDNHFVATVEALPATTPPPGLTTNDADDPTTHPTFATAALPEFAGQILWSDLSYAQFDEGLPEMSRQVGVYAQTAVRDARGQVRGVVRVGLATRTLDVITQKASEGATRVVLADGEGRLLTRLMPTDRLVETPDENLRMTSTLHDPAIVAAQTSPLLLAVNAQNPWAGQALEHAGQRCRLTAQFLAHTQDWRVLVAVDEARLPGLQAMLMAKQQTLALTLAVALLIGAGGLLALRAVRRGLGRIVASAASMQQMHFAPGKETAFFRDVEVALRALESAKLAGRAMGRYIPVDLVRRLFAAQEEPRLGGELRDVTILFTDVADFTKMSEHLPPDELARLMGEYLQVMTESVHQHRGIVDKFIGDAVMAIWNAPTPCENHPLAACETVLACQKALAELYQSPAWRGQPPWQTRFGLHRAEVMVGHFGAPDRLSYTALGDGVNVAARLEGLNKVYGTTAMASATVVAATRDQLHWRHLDRVAVVGRSEGIDVFELREEADEGVAAYEAAWALYAAGDFASAAAGFATLTEDPAAQVLAARARAYAEKAPTGDWHGVFVAQGK